MLPLHFQVDHWLSTASGPLSCGGDISVTLEQLNKALAPSSVLVGKSTTVADTEVFAALYSMLLLDFSLYDRL